MELNNIDNIYCINLEKRVDRRERCNLLFKKYNLKFNYFKAIDGNNLKHLSSVLNKGAIGCCLSHYKIWEDIVIKNNKISLITEDDVIFHDDVLQLFKLYYPEVPSDWNLLYFGGNHCKQKLNFISNHVHKLSNTYTTHCYAITLECAKYLINKFNLDTILTKQIDVNLADVQKEISCYGFYPHLAWQDNGFSDIENKIVDYTFLKHHE